MQNPRPMPIDLFRLLPLCLALVSLLALASPALAAEASGAAADSGKSWFAFLGRLHVVVLHLPIGLIIGAFVIELFGVLRRSRGYDVAAAWLFVFGFLASVAAVVTGLLLGTEVAASSGKEGGAELTAITLLFADADKGVSETMGLHMWLGVGLMLFAGLAAVLKIMAVNKQWPRDTEVREGGGWPLIFSRLVLLGIMAMLPVAGHLGGNMTHGEKYLFARAPFNVPDSIVYFPGEPPEATQVVTVSGKDAKPDGSVAAWNAVIQPALNESCVRCHGPSKDNGDIRLDSLARATASEAFVMPMAIANGDAQQSALYVVVTLPGSHYSFMPPADAAEEPLSAEVLAFLGEWIQNYDGRTQDPDGTTSAGAGDAGDAPDTAAQDAGPRIDPKAVRAIEDAGGTAQSLSQEQDPHLLTINFAYQKNMDARAADALAATADSVVWLTFAGSSFDDAAAERLPAMPLLTELNLKDTRVTDAGLAALPAMPTLERLNLFGTKITDAGLDAIKRYTSLKKVYLTGTGVSAEGVAALRAALPDARVLSDHDAQFQPAVDGIPSGDAQADAEPALADPVNTACIVSGAPLNPEFFVIYEGKKVGFCCGDCKAKFEADPSAFASKLP